MADSDPSASPPPAAPSSGLPPASESGSIAHDLRNLLNAANINLHLVMRKADDPEAVRRWTAKSIEALAAANVMITERLSRQKGAPAPRAGGLNVDARLEAMRPLLARALPRTAVDYALAAGAASAACDGDSLEAAVFNLAVNAREAMQGAGRIALATRVTLLDKDPELAPAAYVELQVRDEGPGLPAEVAADPFTAPPEAEGDEEVPHAELRTALAQVQSFARAAGGLARITRSDAQGTEITLWLKAV